ncbi:hypothetical protein TWF481_002009 [Arthrobotrys musiformis]|uniref:Mid2 domain-containing protein n=1 Tax=Arthrobotrys musiformis TaxID=47236 RepID=A0AAV9VX09_9PEZI
MATRYISTIILTLLSLQLAAAATLAARQSPTPTYTYTTDTVIKPTANARYQVGIPISVSWYIPKTTLNQNTAQSFNTTIALDGVVGVELSQAVSFPGWGDHDTTFTPRDTWPESNKYQIFIFMDYGMKTLKSPNFGIWGGGKPATSTVTSSQASTSTSPSTTTGESEPSTSSDSEATSASASETSDPSPTENSNPAPSNGISGAVLGSAIGGSVVGTLAIVGLVWFMRRNMAKSRANHGSDKPNNSNTNNTPPGYQNNNGNGNQQWPYQQMNAPSTTSVNHLNNEYKGSVHPPPPPSHPLLPNSATVNEMPTQMHHEPVELYTMPQHSTAAEMPGDMNWNMPPPAPVAQAQQQPQKYVYGPQSYDR